jgi:hypothetical protein
MPTIWPRCWQDQWLERNPLRVELKATPDPRTLERLRALGYLR